jgi:hypothetical protein
MLDLQNQQTDRLGLPLLETQTPPAMPDDQDRHREWASIIHNQQPALPRHSEERENERRRQEAEAKAKADAEAAGEAQAASHTAAATRQLQEAADLAEEEALRHPLASPRVWRAQVTAVKLAVRANVQRRGRDRQQAQARAAQEESRQRSQELEERLEREAWLQAREEARGAAKSSLVFVEVTPKKMRKAKTVLPPGVSPPRTPHFLIHVPLMPVPLILAPLIHVPLMLVALILAPLICVPLCVCPRCSQPEMFNLQEHPRAVQLRPRSGHVYHLP